MPIGHIVLTDQIPLVIWFLIYHTAVWKYLKEKGTDFYIPPKQFFFKFAYFKVTWPQKNEFGLISKTVEDKEQRMEIWDHIHC